MAILLLVSVSVFVTTAQADGPLPGVDTAERDDVVAEDDEGGASGAVDEDSGARLPDVDTAERDDVVEEEGGASGAADDGSEGRLPDVDTAQRDDVVEEEGGASGAADDGSEGRLPDVDTAQRDDVVEEEGDATGRAANAPAPTGLRVTSYTDDSVSLSWDAGTDAYRYKVEYRRSSSSSWLHAGYTSGTSRTVSELDPNTAYDFQVRARGDGSPYSYTYGSPSTSVPRTTGSPTAPAPTGLRATASTETSVSLSWNAGTDAYRYKVEYRRSSSSSWLHAGYTSGTSRTVSRLDPNTAYDFQVRARGDGSPYSYTYGSPSTSVPRTTGSPTAPAPTGLRATASTETSVSLSWNAGTDAHRYKVEYRRSSSSSWLHAGYTSGTSRTVSRLDPNTAYDFQVRARGDGSPYSYTYGSPSTSVPRTTGSPTAPAPTGLRATASTETSVSLSWNAGTDAHYYKVEYRRSSSSSWLHAGYTSGTSRTVSRLDPNTAYDFQVRARGDGSPYSYTYGSPSTSVPRTTGSPTAPAPTGLRATASTETSVSLSWNAGTDAHRYKVEYRRSSSSSWLHAGYTSGTSRTVSRLDPNTAYDFQVRARGDGSPYSYTYGSPSTSVPRTTGSPTAPAPTGLRATASTETSVSLSWNAVTDAHYYKVEYRRSSSSSWLHAGYTSGTSRTVSRLDPNTAYDFQVRARGDGSPYSYTYGSPSTSVPRATNVCSTAPPPPAPQNLTGASGPGRGEASLNWDTVAEATGYKVEQRKRRTFAPFLHTWVDLGSKVTIIGSSAVVRNLSVDDTHRFRVKALKADVESEPSNEVDVTLAPPPAPTNVAGSSVDHGKMRIMWDAVLGATGYVVEQHKNVLIGSDWHELPFDSFTVTTPLRSGNRFSAIVRGLTPGDTHKHRVKAVGVQGTSDPSSEVEAEVLDERPPKPNKPAYRFLIGGRGIELFWDVVPVANSYKVLIDPEPNPPAAIAFTNASADITGLVPDSIYTFKVVATNGFGDSPESNGLRARTPQLEYWWGHQADHTVKYEKGAIATSTIEDAIQDAAEDWNDEMRALNKGLKICDDVDISCGGANTDGGIVTIQTAATTKTNDSGGCGNSMACVQPGPGRDSSGPGKHMVNMTMVFEEPAYICSGFMCSNPIQIVWTDNDRLHDDPTPESTAADLEQYAFIGWVMLHEFGHTLGLPDFYTTTSTLLGEIAIMNLPWDAQNIRDEDIRQLKAIYIRHTKH